jgi:uncharacterized protein (TIGR02118 family)
MILVSSFYLNGPDVRFDKAYYHDTHIPHVLERMGDTIKGVFIWMGVGTSDPGAAAPYIATFHALVDSVQAWEDAFRPYAEELQSHIPDYTNVVPVMQYSDVTMASLSPVPLRPAGA